MASAPPTEDRTCTTAARRMARERLLRYIASIITRQTTPLSTVIRDHSLPYLPPQSLHRLRCVSTSWNHHISAPFFAHQHSHTHRSLSGIFFYDIAFLNSISYLSLDPTCHSLPTPSLSFLPAATELEVLASCNGLVACRGIKHWKSRYYICNPATKQWVAIPTSACMHSGGVVALVYQPSVLNFSADYHLVCTVPGLFTLEVFSSTTGKWHRSRAVLAEGERYGRAVAAGGIAYWRTKSGTVVCYDPVADRVDVIAAPKFKEAWWRLGEMGGEVCGLVGGTGLVEVYMLGQGAWTKRAEVAVEGEVRAVAAEGREEMVVVWVEGKVFVVELRSGEKKVVAEGVPEGFVHGVAYIGSMVLLKELGITEAQMQELPGAARDACHINKL